MADIPGNIDKMDDIEIAGDAPMTETLFNKIGANINALIDLSPFINSQTFTSSGTFNVPEGVNVVYVEVQGGGGSGAEGQGTGGAGGQAGARVVDIVAVTPLDAITITIGAGGASVLKSGSEKAWGNNGSSTSFGTLVTALGGAGGHGAFDTGAGGSGFDAEDFGGGKLHRYDNNGTLYSERKAEVAAGGDSPTITSNGYPEAGQGSVNFIGGSPGAIIGAVSVSQAGSGGGSSYYAMGGAGGSGVGGGSAGSSGSLGSGGGGGGVGNGNINQASGAGGDGQIIIRW